MTNHISKDIDKLTAELKTTKEEVARRMIEQTKAKETADRKNITRSMLLARLMHELRSGLVTAVGNLEILHETETSDYQERAIRLTAKSAKFLQQQIDDILEFNLFEAGLYHIDNQVVDINEIVALVTEMMKADADKKSLSLEISAIQSEDLSNCAIESDPVRIQQILINLISNGIKFTESGGVTATIYVDPLDTDRSRARISIRVVDTGIGIEPGYVDRIFEMSEQIQPPPPRKDGAPGVGLAITKRVVEAMNGTISVESSPGKGSLFSVDLVAGYTKSSFTPEQRAALNTGLKIQKIKHILLVEDDFDNRFVISTLLHNIGIAVDNASTSIEGFGKFKASYYDIVFVDCSMPNMDGFDFTRRLREYETRSGSGTRTLLVGITAGAQPSYIEKCYSAGMDDVITKPFHRVDVYKRVLGLQKARRILEHVSENGFPLQSSYTNG